MEFVANIDVWFEAKDEEAADSIVNNMVTILHNEDEVTGLEASKAEKL